MSFVARGLLCSIEHKCALSVYLTMMTVISNFENLLWLDSTPCRVSSKICKPIYSVLRKLHTWQQTCTECNKLALFAFIRRKGSRCYGTPFGMVYSLQRIFEVSRLYRFQRISNHNKARGNASILRIAPTFNFRTPFHRLQNLPPISVGRFSWNLSGLELVAFAICPKGINFAAKFSS